jgi:non-ribosomal peptide synthase protein (TIGR01720 family)
VPLSDSAGPAYAALGERAHLLELNSGIFQGQFRIAWTYSRNRHRAQTIQALADAFMATLRDLIEYAGRGPGAIQAPADTDPDLVALEISADDLAEILRQQEC